MKDIKLFAKALVFCLAFIAMNANARQQAGYEIIMDISSLGDTPVILGNFFGESTYIIDSSAIENNQHVFRGNQPLAPGMYFIAKNKQRIFDFVVGDDQYFSLSSNTENIIDGLSVEGDEDNALFISDMKYNAARNKDAAPYLNVLRDSSASTTDRESAQASLSSLNDQVQAYRTAIIQEHPASFLAFFYKAQQDNLPDADASKAEIASYKNGYWTNFNLSDTRLLRLNTPLYKEKVNDYLDRWVYQDPDSLIREIDALAAIAGKNPDTYKYFVWLVTLKYQTPAIMGLDALFVHMNDNYFASGEMDFWANEQLKTNVAEFADQLRNSLIGNKAPNMIMPDAQMKPQSLYDIPSRFTVIYFFDPDCHHCKLATPVLNELYSSEKFDMEVYAVSTDTSMVKMRNYIEEMGLTWLTVNGPRTATLPYYKLYDAMTTPTTYILNEDKVIIAKKLPVERIDEFLMNYMARKEE